MIIRQFKCHIKLDVYYSCWLRDWHSLCDAFNHIQPYNSENLQESTDTRQHVRQTYQDYHELSARFLSKSLPTSPSRSLADKLSPSLGVGRAGQGSHDQKLTLTVKQILTMGPWPCGFIDNVHVRHDLRHGRGTLFKPGPCISTSIGGCHSPSTCGLGPHFGLLNLPPG